MTYTEGQHRYTPALLWGCALLLVVILGWGQRFLLQTTPLNTPNHASQLDGSPILSNIDGYFYLNAARDLISDQYLPTDPQRNAPLGLPRRQPAPLLSQLIASVTKLSGLPLAQVAAILPAALGVLIAIPVFFIGRLIAGPITGIGAALLSVLYPFYSFRSSVGWLDTDCLIVSLILAVSATLMYAVHTSGRRQLILFATAILLLCVLFETWDQAPDPVLLLGAAQMGIAFALLRPPGHRRLLMLAIGLPLLAIAAVKYDQLIAAADRAFGFLRYVFERSQSPWPNIAALVGEQTGSAQLWMTPSTSGGAAVTIVALFGLLLFLFHARRLALLLAIPASLALLSVFAQRFLIFSGPFIALGSAYLCWLLWISPIPWLRRFRAIAPLLFLLLAIAMLLPVIGIRIAPLLPAENLRGMIAARQLTPANALIWADWDAGYPIQYWAQRATFADGGLHEGERTVYLYYPLSTDKPAAAAHFMNFIAAHGMAGVGKVADAIGGTRAEAYLALKGLFEAPAATDAQHAIPLPVDFLFPVNDRPLYLFIDNRTAAAINSTWLAGTWDPLRKAGTVANSKAFSPARISADGYLSAPRLVADLNSGRLIYNGEEFGFRSAHLSGDGQQRQLAFPAQDNPLHVEFQQRNQLAMVMPAYITKSVFYRLFFLDDGQQWFERIDLQDGPYQLWKVRPNSASRGASR